MHNVPSYQEWRFKRILLENTVCHGGSELAPKQRSYRKTKQNFFFVENYMEDWKSAQ